MAETRGGVGAALPLSEDRRVEGAATQHRVSLHLPTTPWCAGESHCTAHRPADGAFRTRHPRTGPRSLGQTGRWPLQYNGINFRRSVVALKQVLERALRKPHN